MKRMILAIVVALSAGAVRAAAADEAKGAILAAAPVRLQAVCPVMGRKIDRNLYVEHEGKRVYVCCKGCIGTVQQDPAKYIRQLEAEGITVAKLQTTCPVMGGEIDKSLFVDFEGKRLYVCCQGCIGAVRKDAAKYIAKLEQEGVVLDATPVADAAPAKDHARPAGQ